MIFFFDAAEDKWQDYVYTVYIFSFMQNFSKVIFSLYMVYLQDHGSLFYELAFSLLDDF